MKRLIVLALGLLVAASGAYAADEPPPGDRVVCVSKQINEFIYAIGAEKHLVARDLTSVYPPQITKLPSVGYHRALSAEGILSMRPSVFLTDGNFGPEAVTARLRDVGLPIVTMEPGDTLEGAENLLTRLGAYFHREAQTAQVLATWKQGVAEIEKAAQQPSGRPKPRVLMIHFGQIGNSYLGVGGHGGPADQVLSWAGGTNALDGKGMSRLTPEIIAQSNADIILATDVGYDRFGSAQKFNELPGVALTPAGKSGRIYRIDESEIMYFGPRTPWAVHHIAGLLNKQ